MAFCKVIKVEKRWGLTGSEIYDLTLECGRTVRQTARRSGSRYMSKPKVRVKCEHNLTS